MEKTRSNFKNSFINFILEYDTLNPGKLHQKVKDCKTGEEWWYPTNLIVIDKINRDRIDFNLSEENVLPITTGKKKFYIPCNVLKTVLEWQSKYKRKKLSEHTLKKVAAFIQADFQPVKEALETCTNLEVCEKTGGIKFIGCPTQKKLPFDYDPEKYKCYPVLIATTCNADDGISFFEKLLSLACKNQPSSKPYLLKVQGKLQQWIDTYKALEKKLNVKKNAYLEQAKKYEQGLSMAVKKTFDLLKRKEREALSPSPSPDKILCCFYRKKETTK